MLASVLVSLVGSLPYMFLFFSIMATLPILRTGNVSEFRLFVFTTNVICMFYCFVMGFATFFIVMFGDKFSIAVISLVSGVALSISHYYYKHHIDLYKGFLSVIVSCVAIAISLIFNGKLPDIGG